MSSITYDGHSFADYVSAELVESVAHVVAPETARVPGRPGLVLLSADVEPLELRVRLFLDAPDALTVSQRSEEGASVSVSYSEVESSLVVDAPSQLGTP